MKRMERINEIEDIPSKRLRDGRIWVSATDTYNYMVNDSLVDWLKLNETVEKGVFTNFIFAQGCEFEKNIVKRLNDDFIPVISVSDKITQESCEKTIELMEKGVPIIHSAPFEDQTTRTRGIIDLIVRSDQLNDIFVESPLPLRSKPYYVVIDIKFSTLPLRADGIHLLNSDSYTAYKAQLQIYRNAVNQIQKYDFPCAYLLGRRWSYTQKGISYSGQDSFDRLGVIDYEGVDKEYVQKTEKAISWVRDVRENGKSWVANSRPELLPNMCVDSGGWNCRKKELAIANSDITMIWQCGMKHRKNAIDRGILSWKDERCTSNTLGINGSYAPIINEILNINRQEIDKIRPAKVVQNLAPCNEVFVDFETFADVFDEHTKTDAIFMVGIYYCENETWKYKNFISEENTLDCEFQIMDAFVSFIKQLGNPKLWYWHAEPQIWRTAECRQLDRTEDAEKIQRIATEWILNDWTDLCQVFRKEPIVVKGAFAFGLKDIASAMQSHGMISATIESNCMSGLEASVYAWESYKTGNKDIMRDIEKYNEFDVKVLYEILTYLRKLL